MTKIVLLLKGVGWRGNVATVGSPSAPTKNVGTTQQSSSLKEVLILNVGKSHPVILPVPSGIHVSFSDNVAGENVSGTSSIVVTPKEGIEFNESLTTRIGDFAARIESVRKWNPYTGQGIYKIYSVSSDDVRICPPRRRKVGKRK